MGIPLSRGMKVSTITFWSGGTGAGTPTNQWFTLRDSARVLLGVTADDTTTAWGTNVAKTLTLASPVVIPADGFYYIGIMVKATTTPTMTGIASISTGPRAANPIPAGTTADTGLTDPASAPSTAGALTAAAAHFYGSVV